MLLNENPLIVFKPEYFSDAGETITTALRSAASTALPLLIGIITIFMIANILNFMLSRYLSIRNGVERRELSRKIAYQDMDENKTDIINLDVKKMEFDLIGRARFRAKNSDLILEEKVSKLNIDNQFMEKHRLAIIENGVNKLHLKHDIKIAYLDEYYEDALIEKEYYDQINDEYYRRRRRTRR